MSPLVLTIGGVDPSSGGGLSADLETLAAHGCFGMSACTAVTAQNSREVRLVEPVRAEVLQAQIETLLSDFRFAAVKIGMLATEANVGVVAAALRRDLAGVSVVLDPVLAASSGDALSTPAMVSALRSELLSLVTLVTPNLDEARALTETTLTPGLGDEAEMTGAGLSLVRSGARAVLVKGGHLAGAPRDVLVTGDGAGDVRWFATNPNGASARVASHGVRGTGCRLAAAIAAGLARGLRLDEAVHGARDYVGLLLATRVTHPGAGRGYILPG